MTIGELCRARMERAGYRVAVHAALKGLGSFYGEAQRPGRDKFPQIGPPRDTRDDALTALFYCVFGVDCPLPERKQVSRDCPLLDGSLDQARLFGG